MEVTEFCPNTRGHSRQDHDDKWKQLKATSPPFEFFRLSCDDPNLFDTLPSTQGYQETVKKTIETSETSYYQ